MSPRWSLRPGREAGAGVGAPPVRGVEVSDVPRLLGLLARAFARDPFVAWVVRGGPGREDRAGAYFDLMLRRVSLARAGAFTTADLAGVAAWVPPGAWPPSFGAQVAMLPQTLSFVGLARLGAVAATIEADLVRQDLLESASWLARLEHAFALGRRALTEVTALDRKVG